MQYAVVAETEGNELAILAVVNGNHSELRDEDAASLAHKMCADLIKVTNQKCQVLILDRVCFDTWLGV